MKRGMKALWRRPQMIVAAAIVTALAVGLPAATTRANLTDVRSTTSAATTAGDWCAVPGTSQFSNVYKLSDFTPVNAPEGSGTTAVRMFILPVVNNGDFAPVGGASTVPTAQTGQVGLRLWGCSDLNASAASIKATAWRSTYATQSLSWDVPPSNLPLSAARLSATGTLTAGATSSQTRPGAELRDLHRGKNSQGGMTAAGANGVTTRYSWLLSNGRDKTPAKHQLAPVCSVATAACAITPVSGGDGVPGLANAFSTSETAPTAGAVSGNSAIFLASKYYASGGTWPKTTTTVTGVECRWFRMTAGGWTSWEFFERSSCPQRWGWVSDSRPASRALESDSAPSSSPTILQSAAGLAQEQLLRDVSGDYLQWVVLEWWGGSNPPSDIEVEVFVK